MPNFLAHILDARSRILWQCTSDVDEFTTSRCARCVYMLIEQYTIRPPSTLCSLGNRRKAQRDVSVRQAYATIDPKMVRHITFLLFLSVFDRPLPISWLRVRGYIPATIQTSLPQRARDTLEAVIIHSYRSARQLSPADCVLSSYITFVILCSTMEGLCLETPAACIASA